MQIGKITALVLFAAFASTAAPAQTQTPAATTAKPAAKERTALSKDCSAQATAKSLHGKERKKFRSACKKGKAL